MLSPVPGLARRTGVDAGMKDALSGKFWLSFFAGCLGFTLGLGVAISGPAFDVYHEAVNCFERGDVLTLRGCVDPASFEKPRR